MPKGVAVNVVRVSISLPAVLKERMEKVGGLRGRDRRAVNWSAVAAAAFERYLDGTSPEAELAWFRREHTKLKKVLARVRDLAAEQA